MAIQPCPNANESCVWFDRPTPDCLKSTQEHGCFSDNDHILPRFLGGTALQLAFLNLPDNQQQLCRGEHDEKTRRELLDPPVLPDDEVIKKTVLNAITSGIINCSKRKLKRLGLENGI